MDFYGPVTESSSVAPNRTACRWPKNRLSINDQNRSPAPGAPMGSTLAPWRCVYIRGAKLDTYVVSLVFKPFPKPLLVQKVNLRWCFGWPGHAQVVSEQDASGDLRPIFDVTGRGLNIFTTT
jgi:hypothetical protein